MKFILVLAFFALVGVSLSQQVNDTFGYCDVWLGGECAAWMASYNTNVFFYTPAVPRDTQRAQLASSLTSLSQFAGIAAGDCGLVLMPFVCANLFTPCMQYNTSTVDMTIRRPTCQSVCLDVHVKCQFLLNNPLVKSQLSAVPQLQAFLECNATDPYINNLPSFPDAPGYVIDGQAVPCSDTLPIPASPTVPPAPVVAVAPGVNGPANGPNAPANGPAGNTPLGSGPTVTQNNGPVTNANANTAGVKAFSFSAFLVSALVAVVKFM